ncbi:MAG TPA: dienelactone hydrolase family protein [Blastocatellia bacterium]|jgi:dienelactone hydrolase
MNTQYLDYTDGETTCEAYVAYDESVTSKRPCVLVSHQWSGQSDVERKKAEELARLGYVGFAIDIYGKGVRGGLLEDNSKLMQPFVDDRVMLRRRILAALAAAQQHAMVAPDLIGAIGYCFGGLCALDLARSAASGVKGVVSFHGVLHPPNIGEQAPITAKVLILHGYDDPLAAPEHVLAIARELTEAKADWQLHAYGHTMHAFTAEGVNLPERGLVYNAAAARRSWAAMKDFFEETLA